MDAEATTERDGFPTGLNWYGPHAKPEQKQPKSEPNWSKRLAELLNEQAYQAQSEVGYPQLARKRCDVVVKLPDGQRLWMEIKGAWREYWRRQGNLYFYHSYLFHPLKTGLDPKTHTVPHDLGKLDSLTSEDTDHTALLLVGFDSTDFPMDEDVNELVTLTGLGQSPWLGFDESWDDSRRPGERVRCWLWVRPTES